MTAQNYLTLYYPWHEPAEGQEEGRYATSFDEEGSVRASGQISLPESGFELPREGDVLNFEQDDNCPDAPTGFYVVTSCVLNVPQGCGRWAYWIIEAEWRFWGGTRTKKVLDTPTLQS